MLLGAAIGLLVSFSMDVTVASPFDGTRVTNFGLISQRNSIQMVSGFAALCAVLLITLSGRRSSTSEAPGDRIACPACAEPILRAAKICKHCHTEIGTADRPPEIQPSNHDVVNVPVASNADLRFVVGIVIVAAIVAVAMKLGLT
ncbi:hypothetical protein GCT13_13425 [Paraburkholderia sp. CNPSo 3157]|uniref:Zinc ribbon domain-containing protein n=1 Tax=Paraburkholderia franconis TaxID=2654983 RepID=A0A7X1NAC2_9BURK|nr:hypothetical protein [Paraburkholderia franconis]MPW17911.1 hypothetical protein [Paraburkholderia franconis]